MFELYFIIKQIIIKYILAFKFFNKMNNQVNLKSHQQQ
jgi:hypothetical protein